MVASVVVAGGACSTFRWASELAHVMLVPSYTVIAGGAGNLAVIEHVSTLQLPVLPSGRLFAAASADMPAGMQAFCHADVLSQSACRATM